mgnify:CR=1 FL=1
MNRRKRSRRRRHSRGELSEAATDIAYELKNSLGPTLGDPDYEESTNKGYYLEYRNGDVVVDIEGVSGRPNPEAEIMVNQQRFSEPRDAARYIEDQFKRSRRSNRQLCSRCRRKESRRKRAEFLRSLDDEDLLEEWVLTAENEGSYYPDAPEAAVKKVRKDLESRFQQVLDRLEDKAVRRVEESWR